MKLNSNTSYDSIYSHIMYIQGEFMVLLIQWNYSRNDLYLKRI